MHPILIKLGPITLYTYGLFLAIAFFVGLWIGEIRRGNIEKRHILNIVVMIFLFGIIGARLFFVFSNVSYFLKHPFEIVARSGFTFHGGFIFAIIGTFLYCKKNSLSFFKMADILSPSFAIGLAIGRIGCFFEGCCFGKPTNLPWGILFPVGSWAYKEFGQIPVHPTQIYSSVADFLLFLILFWIKNKREGGLFFTFLLCYSFLRFFIELLRFQPIFLFGLTQPQVLFFIIGAISIIWFLGSRSST